MTLIVPRWYQTECVQSFYDFFAALAPGQEGNPIGALPTGTGKSLVIALFCQSALQRFPQTRILVLTHVKELIKQNSDKLAEIAPHIPFGIYSSGLGRRDIAEPIIFGGLLSVVNCQELMSRYFDLILIDECHLVSPRQSTSYVKIVLALMKINPRLRIIGLSATPFRMGQGMLTEEIEIEEGEGDNKKTKTFRLFTDVCYDMTSIEGWQRLIAEGFLCPPITPSRLPDDQKTPLVELDVSNVGVSNGDYKAGELEEAVDKDPVTRAALTQMVQLGQNRWSWLTFAAGIKHAEHIWEMLNDEFGIPACVVHSKRSDKQNDAALTAWKRGEARAAVNMNSLTTGVDHPPCDLISMMRPTLSPGLWVQMLGRGSRPFDFENSGYEYAMNFPFKKQNFLVLDFARNTKKLGPINDPKIPNRKGKGGGMAPIKICDECGFYNHTRARFCEQCNYEFPFQVDISKTASTEDIIRDPLPITNYFDVLVVSYNRFVPKKAGSHPMIRVDYNCGIQRFSEWLCFEHPGFPKHRAHEWWKQNHWTIPPATVDEALQLIAQARKPTRIRVWVNKKEGPEVLSREY